jgi:hypothetical protein
MDARELKINDVYMCFDFIAIVLDIQKIKGSYFYNKESICIKYLRIDWTNDKLRIIPDSDIISGKTIERYYFNSARPRAITASEIRTQVFHFIFDIELYRG